MLSYLGLSPAVIIVMSSRQNNTSGMLWMFV